MSTQLFITFSATFTADQRMAVSHILPDGLAPEVFELSLPYLRGETAVVCFEQLEGSARLWNEPADDARTSLEGVLNLCQEPEAEELYSPLRDWDTEDAVEQLQAVINALTPLLVTYPYGLVNYSFSS